MRHGYFLETFSHRNLILRHARLKMPLPLWFAALGLAKKAARTATLKMNRHSRRGTNTQWVLKIWVQNAYAYRNSLRHFYPVACRILGRQQGKHITTATADTFYHTLKNTPRIQISNNRRLLPRMNHRQFRLFEISIDPILFIIN